MSQRHSPLTPWSISHTAARGHPGAPQSAPVPRGSGDPQTLPGCSERKSKVARGPIRPHKICTCPVTPYLHCSSCCPSRPSFHTGLPAAPHAAREHLPWPPLHMFHPALGHLTSPGEACWGRSTWASALLRFSCSYKPPHITPSPTRVCRTWLGLWPSNPLQPHPHSKSRLWEKLSAFGPQPT